MKRPPHVREALLPSAKLLKIGLERERSSSSPSRLPGGLTPRSSISATAWGGYPPPAAAGAAAPLGGVDPPKPSNCMDLSRFRSHCIYRKLLDHSPRIRSLVCRSPRGVDNLQGRWNVQVGTSREPLHIASCTIVKACGDHQTKNVH